MRCFALAAVCASVAIIRVSCGRASTEAVIHPAITAATLTAAAVLLGTLWNRDPAA
jgi:hypothetical protein